MYLPYFYSVPWNDGLTFADHGNLLYILVGGICSPVRVSMGGYRTATYWLNRAYSHIYCIVHCKLPLVMDCGNEATITALLAIMEVF